MSRHTEKSPGFTLYSLSNMTRTRSSTARWVSLRELLDYAGGVRAERRHEVLDARRVVDAASHRRAPRRAAPATRASARPVRAGARRWRRRRGTTCVVRAVGRWTDFYKHESCGKCTPCREGTFWLKSDHERLETGHGTPRIWTSCSTSPTRFSAKSFCAWAMARQARSRRRSNTSATNTSRVEAADVRSTPSCPCSRRTETTRDTRRRRCSGGTPPRRKAAGGTPTRLRGTYR